MTLTRIILIGVIAAALAAIIVACQPSPTNRAPQSSEQQSLSVDASVQARQHSDETVWGRVPYCNCLADSATANVAIALKKAHLTAALKEQSPRDGWLYFVVTFDSQAASLDQIHAAMQDGGAEVIEGPP